MQGTRKSRVRFRERSELLDFLLEVTGATTNTLDLKIIRPVDRPDNVVSSVANTNMNAKWLVKLNNSRLANQIAGV